MKNSRFALTITLFGTLTAALAASAVPALGRAVPDEEPEAWSWPLAGSPELLRPFDRPALRWSPGHRGIDLGTASSRLLRAPAPGIVSYVGTVVDRQVLVIDHGDGLLSSFEPVTGAPRTGTLVAAGDELGRVSTGGHCAARCLHWGLRLDGEYIDPMLTISDRRPSILLPLGD